jgi:predicted aminopeptidase
MKFGDRAAQRLAFFVKLAAKNFNVQKCYLNNKTAFNEVLKTFLNIGDVI